MSVASGINFNNMHKIQVYLRKKEHDALRNAAARSGRSVAELIREAGPVVIWDGRPKRTSVEHDGVHEEPYAPRKDHGARSRGP
jgi:hypothetical protein